MEKTPSGTAVGVDDPYDHAGLCDHLTDEGLCRYAFEHPQHDPEFARERREDEFACPVAREAGTASERATEERSDSRADSDGDWNWSDCPHFRCRNRDRRCIRCGLEERRIAHSNERPLLEEHHLSYAGELRSPSNQTQSDDAGEGETLSHEITVYLCRWCHAKVHKSWARIDDDVNPDPEAIAEAEGRRSREQVEAAFETAADRYDDSME
jgi:hypothetical protein